MNFHIRKRHVLVAGMVLVVFLVLFVWRKANPLIGMDGLDPALIEEVRGKLLHAPSRLPYALAQPEVDDVSVGQSKLILEVLSNKTGGTFVECGALDGESRSNTLYMERFLGWRGLLVEADSSNFEMLMKKNRRAWAIHACLSGNKVSQTLSVEFRHVPEGKKAIRKLMESKGYEVYTEITHYDDLANDFIFKKKV